MFYFFITSTYILAGVRYIIIQIFTFFLTLNINIYTTENINRLCNRFEIKGYIIIDINIQVTVQHRHCLLRSTVCVSRIGFLELLLLSLTGNKYVILILMNIILLIVGTFMDPTPAVLIFTPIFLPICKTFGMHAVQFGIMVSMNLCIGTITPPVGSILFTGCKVGHVKIEQVIKELLPYFFAILVALLLVTYIPAISMTLPTLAGLIK